MSRILIFASRNSVLSRNRQGLSITFRGQLVAGNRKGSF